MEMLAGYRKEEGKYIRMKFFPRNFTNFIMVTCMSLNVFITFLLVFNFGQTLSVG